ncbi:hypothetical protein HK102_004204 [Quaeritorhiza haematococci]|nr:hypothetical protein HK102_004204 [Quaeritorhiza haematococci]
MNFFRFSTSGTPNVVHPQPTHIHDTSPGGKHLLVNPTLTATANMDSSDFIEPDSHTVSRVSSPSTSSTAPSLITLNEELEEEVRELQQRLKLRDELIRTSHKTMEDQVQSLEMTVTQLEERLLSRDVYLREHISNTAKTIGKLENRISELEEALEQLTDQLRKKMLP